MINPQITNLIFQGGSVKGVAYIGALQVLGEKIDMTKIKRVAGTSAGAITAGLLALGCDMVCIEKLLLEFNFKAILDDNMDKYIPTQPNLLKSIEKQEQGKSTFFSKIPAKSVKIPIAYRLVQHRGIYEGEYLREWMENVIQEQVQKISQGKYSGKHLTFLELHQLTEEYPGLLRDLVVVGVNVTANKKVVFSYDNPATQHAIISDAIRISMSIPALFKPHYLYCKINGERLIDLKREEWVDGGLHDNYPIDCFDQQQYMEAGQLLPAEDGRLYNPHTLGFRLVSSDRKEFYEGNGEEPTNELDNAIAFYKVQLNARAALQEDKYKRREHHERTIYIDHLNISTLAFNLSKEQQQALIQSGKAATQQYLKQLSISSVPFVNDETETTGTYNFTF